MRLQEEEMGMLPSEVFPVGMTHNAEMFHTVHEPSHHKHVKKLGNNPLGNGDIQQKNVKETRRRM